MHFHNVRNRSRKYLENEIPHAGMKSTGRKMAEIELRSAASEEAKGSRSLQPALRTQPTRNSYKIPFIQETKNSLSFTAHFRDKGRVNIFLTLDQQRVFSTLRGMAWQRITNESASSVSQSNDSRTMGWHYEIFPRLDDRIPNWRVFLHLYNAIIGNNRQRTPEFVRMPNSTARYCLSQVSRSLRSFILPCFACLREYLRFVCRLFSSIRSTLFACTTHPSIYTTNIHSSPCVSFFFLLLVVYSPRTSD